MACASSGPLPVPRTPDPSLLRRQECRPPTLPLSTSPSDNEIAAFITGQEKYSLCLEAKFDALAAEWGRRSERRGETKEGAKTP